MTVFGPTGFSWNPNVEPYSYAPKQKDIHPCEGKKYIVWDWALGSC